MACVKHTVWEKCKRGLSGDNCIWATQVVVAETYTYIMLMAFKRITRELYRETARMDLGLH